MATAMEHFEMVKYEIAMACESCSLLLLDRGPCLFLYNDRLSHMYNTHLLRDNDRRTQCKNPFTYAQMFIDMERQSDTQLHI